MTLSPRLRRQLGSAGVDATRLDVTGLDEAVRRALPILRPADLDLDRFADPVGDGRLVGADPPVRLGVCERLGSTIVLAWSPMALAREAERGARMLAEAGAGPRMRIANTLEGGLATPGSLLLGDAIERLGALDVPLGPVHDAKTAGAMRDLLAAIAAEVLVLDPASAAPLAGVLAGSPPTGLRLVVALGDGELPRMPVPVRRWLSIPEVAAFLALDCRAGKWHVAPEIDVEERDDRLLLSALDAEAPLLRYDGNLVGRRLGGACECGRGGTIVELSSAGPN